LGNRIDQIKIYFFAVMFVFLGAVLTDKALADNGQVIGLPSVGTYAIDPPHTFAYFSAQHEIVGLVRGRFDKITGTLVIAKDPSNCTVDVKIESASLSTQNIIRDADLKSAAFFDAEKYPIITYQGKGIRRSGDNWIVNGTLTIRDVTKMIPLTFKFKGTSPIQPGKPKRVAFHALSAPCRRDDFNMTRDDLEQMGPKPTGPDVWIDIDVEAVSADEKK
jgi:polyisoprenoid-binding protein YceI